MQTKTKRNKLFRFTRNWSLCDIREVPPAWQWAEEKRMMPGSVTAKPGPYRTEITPYVRGIQDSFDDDAVQVVVLCLASRLGKTESFLNLMGRAMDVDPCNMLVTYPTIDAAKVFFNESVQPMIDSARCFRGKVSSMRKRDGQNTQLKKKFPGGTLRGIGANVPSAFRGVQARIVIGDEIDAMETGKEGDPIDLLFKRAENYPNAIQVLSSTPTITGTSRIWEWLDKSDWGKWFVPSPFGEHWHVLDWENVKWDEGKPETARYVDPETGDDWTEEQRKHAISKGEWRSTREFAGIKGFWADGLVSLFPAKKGYESKLHQYASEFLQAKRNGPQAMQVWHNTFRALPWEEEAETVEWEIVASRAEQYEPDKMVPDRILLVTFAADVQEDRIEIEWVGWGEDYESWGLRYAVIPGDTKRPETWEKLAEELRRTWKHPTDGNLRYKRGFIDEGFRPDMVRRFCVRMLTQGHEVYPCKGIGRTGVMEPELVTFKPNKTQKGLKAPTWNVGSNRAKRTIYNHLLAEAPGPNTMHWPEGNGYDQRFFEMLTAERVMTRYSFGKPYKVFDCPPGARNESLDIRGYNYAAIYSMNPQWEILYARRKPKPAPPKPQEQPFAEKTLTSDAPTVNESDRGRRQPRRTSSTGFVNNW